MKKHIFFIAIVFIAIPCFSQDIISLKRGQNIEVIVTEITPEVVRYKLFSDPQGRTYFEYKDAVSSIKYKDGRMESLNQPVDQTDNSASYNPDQQNNSLQTAIDENQKKVETRKTTNAVITGESQPKNRTDNFSQQSRNDNAYNSYKETNPTYASSYNSPNNYTSPEEFFRYVKCGGVHLNYKGIVELGYQYGVGDYGMDRLKFSFINGIQVNPYFSIGLGVGLRYYLDPQAALIPIFADFRANFSNSKLSPYISLGAGYSISTSNDLGGGFLINPTVGVSMKISDKSAVNVGIGYEMQNMGYTVFGVYDNYYNGTLNSGAISLVVGISF